MSSIQNFTSILCLKKYKKKFFSISFTSKVSSLWLILSTKSIKSARKINFFIQKIIFTLAIPSEIFSIFMDPGHNSWELMVILLWELLNNSLELGLSVNINDTKAKMLIIFKQRFSLFSNKFLCFFKTKFLHWRYWHIIFGFEPFGISGFHRYSFGEFRH